MKNNFGFNLRIILGIEKYSVKLYFNTPKISVFVCMKYDKKIW